MLTQQDKQPPKPAQSSPDQATDAASGGRGSGTKGVQKLYKKCLQITINKSLDLAKSLGGGPFRRRRFSAGHFGAVS